MSSTRPSMCCSSPRVRVEWEMGWCSISPGIMTVTYSSTAQFLDKTLLNYSSIFGLQTALHLTGSMYSWTGR